MPSKRTGPSSTEAHAQRAYKKMLHARKTAEWIADVLRKGQVLPRAETVFLRTYEAEVKHKATEAFHEARIAILLREDDKRHT